MDNGPLKPGDVVDGKYCVERILGEGGMGVVVAARHLDLGHPVAIKVLREPFVADSEQAARFLREGRAAVQLTGDHSVRVLDVGRLPSGSPFLVMERLKGHDLGQVLLDRGPLPVEEAADYVLQACEGIAEAHARGLVHRDLKLANLFLTMRGDGTALVKVLDFGLVKATGPEHDDHALTRSQAVMGSPAYMSPEQLRASRDVTKATDTWSLGVCLYELVTGQLPYDAPNVADLMMKVLSAPAPLLHEVRPGVPPGLTGVVARCLAKRAEDRFSDVAELARALEPFANPESAGASGRVQRWLMQSSSEVTEVPQPGVGARTNEQVRTEAAWDSSRRESRTRRFTGIAAAGFAGFGVIVGLALMAIRRAAPADDARTVATAAASSTAFTQPSATPPVPVAPSGEPQAAPPATGSGTAVDASAPAVATRRAAPTPAKRVGAPSMKPVNNCDPPVFTDQLGHVHLKDGCQ